jgi:hypothetical protein
MTERECDDGKRLGRLEKTRQFLRAADLVEVFLCDTLRAQRHCGG